MPMMFLGLFPFSISTVAYQTLKHSTTYNWGEQNRVGHPIAKRYSFGGPALQYMGKGQDTIQLEGTVYPQLINSGVAITIGSVRTGRGRRRRRSKITGRLSAFDPMEILRLLAGTGVPRLLISNAGSLFGYWIIKQIEDTHTLFFEDGSARKIEFNMSLQRHVELELWLFDILRGVF